MGWELHNVVAMIQAPPGYAIRLDGLFRKLYYAIEDDDFGTIVTATYERIEDAAAHAWRVYQEKHGV
jgi:hypothetical protein